MPDTGWIAPRSGGYSGKGEQTGLPPPGPGAVGQPKYPAKGSKKPARNLDEEIVKAREGVRISTVILQCAESAMAKSRDKLFSLLEEERRL